MNRNIKLNVKMESTEPEYIINFLTKVVDEIKKKPKKYWSISTNMKNAIGEAVYLGGSIKD